MRRALKPALALPALVTGLLAVACGDDGAGTQPTVSDMVGDYAAVFEYAVAAEPPFNLSDARSCDAVLTVDQASTEEFSGQFDINDPTCLLEPESGTFSGIIDGGGEISVVGLYATVVAFDKYDCGISAGGTAMTGHSTGHGFTVDANATFSCVIPGFRPVAIETDLTVTAVHE